MSHIKSTRIPRLFSHRRSPPHRHLTDGRKATRTRRMRTCGTSAHRQQKGNSGKRVSGEGKRQKPDASRKNRREPADKWLDAEIQAVGSQLRRRPGACALQLPLNSIARARPTGSERQKNRNRTRAFAYTMIFHARLFMYSEIRTHTTDYKTKGKLSSCKSLPFRLQKARLYTMKGNRTQGRKHKARGTAALRNTKRAACLTSQTITGALRLRPPAPHFRQKAMPCAEPAATADASDRHPRMRSRCCSSPSCCRQPDTRK